MCENVPLQLANCLVLTSRVVAAASLATSSASLVVKESRPTVVDGTVSVVTDWTTSAADQHRSTALISWEKLVIIVQLMGEERACSRTVRDPIPKVFGHFLSNRFKFSCDNVFMCVHVFIILFLSYQSRKLRPCKISSVFIGTSCNKLVTAKQIRLVDISFSTYPFHRTIPSAFTKSCKYEVFSLFGGSE